jgi:hypothetical protein
MDPDADSAIFASDLQDVNKKFNKKVFAYFFGYRKFTLVQIKRHKKSYITVEISVPDPNLDPHVIGLPDPDPSISKQK